MSNRFRPNLSVKLNYSVFHVESALLMAYISPRGIKKAPAKISAMQFPNKSTKNVDQVLQPKLN